MKILINNQEQDNIKAIQVDDYWVIVDTKAEIKGLYFDSYINKIRSSNDAEYVKADFTNNIIASTKFIDKSIPVIKFVEQSVEELAEKQVEIEGWGKYDGTSEQVGIKNSFISGYSQAKSFDKKWSDEEVLNLQQAILCNQKDAIQNTNYALEYLNQPKLYPDVINLDMEEIKTKSQVFRENEVPYCIYKLKTTSTSEGEVIYINI